MPEAPYRRRFGDRSDGRLLRSLPAINKFMPFIMRTRNDACNYFRDSIEVTEIDRWIRQKRAEGYKGLGIMHLFLAAYIRTVATRPALNRFVCGQRISLRYFRDDGGIRRVQQKRARKHSAPKSAVREERIDNVV